ncbi:MAG TPA: hypothetical protein DCQ83_08750 [Fibrobacteres bacterium]|nr:hypothetical protein [Fibrobacterota bacterium]
MGALSLSACIFGGEDDAPAPSQSSRTRSIKPGFYRLDYGSDSMNALVESEMILDSNGGYRQFYIGPNISLDPVISCTGKWGADSTTLAFSERVIGYAWGGLFEPPPGDFEYFEQAPPDSGPIRRISTTSFQRYENDQLTNSNRWLTYRKSTPLPALTGKYEREMIDSISDSTKNIRWTWRYEFTPGGRLADCMLRDGKIVDSITSDAWRQAGNFMVLGMPRFRSLRTDTIPEVFAPPDTLFGEWVLRLQNVNANGFEITYGDEWLAYRKVP